MWEGNSTRQMNQFLQQIIGMGGRKKKSEGSTMGTVMDLRDV